MSSERTCLVGCTLAFGRDIPVGENCELGLGVSAAGPGKTVCSLQRSIGYISRRITSYHSSNG